MSIQQAGLPLTRRRALQLGASLTSGLVAAGALGGGYAFADADDNGSGSTPGKQVQDQIQDILEAEGQAQDGVFQVEIDRNDIMDVHWHGIPILPSFQINGTFFFQSLGNGQTMMNGDFPLKSSELNPFIEQLIEGNIVFQAEHQHMYDFEPDVWFVQHFRGMGDEEMLARSLKAALDKTSTPFPQKMPSNPKTPLPAQQIGEILGAKPQIGAKGVVTYDLPRKETIWLGGHKINPDLNVATNVVFQPHGGGRNAVVIPDFALIASEINRVVGYMHNQGWDIGCLYNQETDENPQLYFSHQGKWGDALQLAHQIRMALNMTNTRFD